MSEIYRPKKFFARSTIVAVILIAVLNVLVNVSFVSYSPPSKLPREYIVRALTSP